MIHILLASVSILCPPAQHATTQPAARSVIRATGIGFPPRHLTGARARARALARRAAEGGALRTLAAKLAASEQPPARLPARQTRLKASLRGFRYLEPRYLPDGSVEVTVEWPVTSGALRARLGGCRPPPGPPTTATPAQTQPIAPTPVPEPSAGRPRLLAGLDRSLALIGALLEDVRQWLATAAVHYEEPHQPTHPSSRSPVAER